MTKATFVFSNELGLMDSAKELGFDTIFIGYQNLTPEWIGKAKELNLTVNVEVGIFAGSEYWEKYPDARPITRDENPYPVVDWYSGVNPLSVGVWQEKLAVIQSVLKEFKPDGIWLDFMRFPCHWEVENPDLSETDFHTQTIEKFMLETGMSDPSGAVWWQWKRDVITDKVGEVRNLIDNFESNTKLGIFAVPWLPTDFDNSINKIICQDFGSLSQYVDVFSPMAYHAMCGKNRDWISEISNWFKQFGIPVLPLVQTENKPREISAHEFKESINEASSVSDGATIFFLDDLLKSPEKLEVIRNIW